MHNYFPVPKEDFVINLCSTNDHIFNRSIEFCLNSIKISKSFGIKKYAVHAGFFFDFPSSQAGNKKNFKLINSKLVCLNNFYKAWSILKGACNNELDLYIENNVFSLKDSQSFNGDKPYMLLDFSDFNEIRSKINFHLLLDVAHLYVSSNTLGKSFKKELDNYISHSDYIHYSENDKIADLNKGADYRTEIFSSLSQYDLSKKTITLEIYGNLDSLVYSYNKFLAYKY